MKKYGIIHALIDKILYINTRYEAEFYYILENSFLNIFIAQRIYRLALNGLDIYYINYFDVIAIRINFYIYTKYIVTIFEMLNR